MKILITDGTTPPAELHSQEELEGFVSKSTDPAKLRIWVFPSSEWISYTLYKKRYAAEKPGAGSNRPGTAAKQNGFGMRWATRFLFGAALVSGALLIINFTSVKWEIKDQLKSQSAWPSNVRPIDIDSLISMIEFERMKPLDRSTRTNLRLRNTWPDRILLQLSANQETRNGMSRYADAKISIDNTTGMKVDEAVVEFFVWKNGQIERTDTLQFKNIGYDKMPVRQLNGYYRGDSLSVSFRRINARAFNFCYSSRGNQDAAYYDPWFCPGGSIASNE
jgi:hypothetical protein